MTTSRREFLGAAAGTVAALPLGWQWISSQDGAMEGPAARAAPPAPAIFGCRLLDLPACCALPESLMGYAQGLRLSPTELAAIDFAKLNAASLRSTLIVPGLSAAPPETARRLQAAVDAGARLLVECGALFAGEAQFELHQRMLRSHFALEVQPAIDLWPATVSAAAAGAGSHHPAHYADRFPFRLGRQAFTSLSDISHSRTPYIEYTWPVKTLVRDFSRVVAVTVRLGDTIVAYCPSPSGDRLPIALKRQVGEGTLIYLGSPVGPVLLGGDAQARTWLRSVLTVA